MHPTQLSPSNTAGAKHWANQIKGLTHSCSQEQAERLWLIFVAWFKQSLSTSEGLAVHWLPTLPHCHSLMLGFMGLVKGRRLISQLRRKLILICVCLKLTWIFPDLHYWRWSELCCCPSYSTGHLWSSSLWDQSLKRWSWTYPRVCL